MSKYDYLIGKEFESIYNQKFKVVNKAVIGEKVHYIILFTETNYEHVVRPENIISRRVKDWSLTPMYIVNKYFETQKSIQSNNYGDFIVVSRVYKKDRYYVADIKFKDTGYVTSFRTDSIVEGDVRDLKKPTVAGVGYNGDIKISHGDIFGRKIYQIWRNMIKRCYDKSRHDYNRYGGKGVTVCNEWHCFKTFYNDVQSLSGFNRQEIIDSKLQLDKDKKCFSNNHRQYNKENCQWLTPKENYKYRRTNRANI